MSKINENPCRDCPNQGCGRQAHCAEYMAFFNRNRERYEKNKMEKGVAAYITESVREVKKRGGPRKSWKRYRPKH